MTSPFRDFQNSRNEDLSQDPSRPHWTHARATTADARVRFGSSSRRTGPTSFSNILNPVEGDWNNSYPRDEALHLEASDNMTHNGSNIEGAAAPSGGFYPTSQQLPESSRAFELFLTRATLDTLNVVDSATSGARTESMAATNNISSNSNSSSSTTFPRPSYLEGSHYLARLEQQTRQRAISQWESGGVQAANGHSGAKSSTPETHYGIARDVVERPPAQEDDDAIDPLPTRWGTAKEDRAAGLEVMADGLEVKYTGPRNHQERENDACAIRADHPMPLQCGLYYFEITVLSRKHNDTTICIGFSSKSVALNRAPGWEPESWGYHGDDGNSFASQNVGKHYGPPFSSGDTIGCGVNFRSGIAFFTKNGRYLGPAFHGVKGKLYPSVGLKKVGEHVRVNFGQTPFMFDIDSTMKSYPRWMCDIFEDSIWRERPVFRSTSVPMSEQRAIVSDHDSPQSPRSLPPLPDEDQPDSEPDWSIPLETIREKTPDLDLPDSVPGSPETRPFREIKYWDWLCLQELLGYPYWTHRGWNEIRHLEQEILQADTSRLAPPLNETELIQQLVLQFLQHDGYVESARAFAQEIQFEKQALCLDPNEEIPGIDIRDDEDANNRQRIRRAILEGDIDKALKHTNAYYPQVLKENEHVYFRLRCRKFIEMIRREAETNIVGGDKRNHTVGNNGHSHAPPGEHMELDEDMEDFDNHADVGPSDLTQVALLYGQSLQAEYAGDERREVRTALEEIFSLMAYQNPLKESKVAHLLDRKGRVAVAEELNSAILQSLGKSSRAALENLYAQTSVLLDDLAETGGPGAFVTLKSIIDEVELNKQAEF